MSNPPTPSSTTPEEGLAVFRARRDRAVKATEGPLALTTTQLIDSEQEVWGVPGRWAPRLPGESGLLLTAKLADNIRVDGDLVDGEVAVLGKDSPEPSRVQFSDTVTAFVIIQEDGGYALRVWDDNSPALANFSHIDAYPYDPDWVITADWQKNPSGTVLGFEHLHSGGKTREKVVPGIISFSRYGVDYKLAAFVSGNFLQLVFADATNGQESYSVGRFLFVAPNDDGTITLDFNRAILPPCAFSLAFNCPLPPRQNRLPFPVRAGEKNALGRDGHPLH